MQKDSLQLDVPLDQSPVARGAMLTERGLLHSVCNSKSAGIIGAKSRENARVPAMPAECNGVALLKGGDEAYRSMLQAIGKAGRRVFLEVYHFADDATGHCFATALMERAQAGLDVRVTYDAVGSIRSARRFFDMMTARGVRVHEFHPLWQFPLSANYRRRTHRKMLIADDAGFVGGMNIASEYASVADGGLGWRDTMVRISGSVVSELTRLFLGLWEQPKIQPRTKAELTAGKQPPGPYIRVLGSSHLTPRCEIGAQYRAAIKTARRTVWISNPYFLPSASFRRGMRKAAKNGVDVRVMVPQHSDISPVLSAAQHFYDRYLQWGIRLFEWTGPMLHAKMAVIDGEWSMIGSFNLDHQSLLHNREVTVMVVDRAFGQQVAGMFEEDFRQCRELSVTSWRGRGLGRRLRERWWALFRALM
jgi:cardiolipin synthase A/B